MFATRFPRALALLTLTAAITTPAVIRAQSTTDGAVGGTVYDAAMPR
jgi:hypothetical protein